MLGVPPADRPRFVRWNDVILRMNSTIDNATPDAKREAIADFMVTTLEMGECLRALLEQRRSSPRDDLLTRLVEAELEGERLTHEEILGFSQLLLLAGSETTTNLINVAILNFIEHSDQLARVRERPANFRPSRSRRPSATAHPCGGCTVSPGAKSSCAARRSPSASWRWPRSAPPTATPRNFPDPDRFDVTRDPNPHLALGRGSHFCLGAPLARLEGRIARTELLGRLDDIERATSEPWQPREGLHVHGPARLPIRFMVRNAVARPRQ